MKPQNETKVLQATICLFFLALCHSIQYVRSGYMIQPLIRAICATAAFIITVITGKKFWNPILFVWAIAIMYWNRFTNYTSFIMILIAISMKPKTAKPYILIYSVCVFISMYLYKDTYTHLAIHAGGCLFFYLAFYAYHKYVMYQKSLIEFLRNEIRNLNKEKYLPLDLTAEEEQILIELVSGKEVKELGYSENTVYKKLKEARIRNNCINNDELKARYRATTRY